MYKTGNIFFRRCLAGFLAGLVFFAGISQVSGDGNEYDVKAMFLYNFTKYVNWPATNSSEPFRIGIVGRSEIKIALEVIAQQKKIDNRQIEIKQVDPGDNSLCQVLFVAKSQTSKVEELVRKYAGKGVLIVSEECRHSEYNATINLVTKENKVRFELNQASARIAGLKIANTLANLAVVVNP